MTDTKKKEFDLRREVLYPACALFCVIVFIFFLVAMNVGINVTESEAERVTEYDNQTGVTDTENGAPAPDALPVQTLLGILMFCIALMALGLLFKLDYSPLMLRLTHFILTELSFFIFILALPGYIADAGGPAAIVACVVLAVLYFAFLGIKLLLGKLSFLHGEGVEKVKRFLLPVFAIFTLIVFVISFFNLISQVNVIVKQIIDEVWLENDVIQTTYVVVATPLAPTLQNYARYLLSALVFMIGYTVLFMNLGKIVKAVLNFIILTAGYMGIWVIGMDYFRLFRANALPAVVAYLAVYLVALIAVSVVLFIRRREAEEDEEYESQFSPRRRKAAAKAKDDASDEE
ncbi:MAG: hypothetical protein IJY04_08725 [Clostridia bacterium]|nr:hypothetical protein [Clostridia bacterium]